MASCDRNTPTPTTPATREDFDDALSQAHIITDIMGELTNAAISTTAKPCAALYDWLVDELKMRLDRIETADQTMRRARA